MRPSEGSVHPRGRGMRDSARGLNDGNREHDGNREYCGNRKSNVNRKCNGNRKYGGAESE